MLDRYEKQHQEMLKDLRAAVVRLEIRTRALEKIEELNCGEPSEIARKALGMIPNE